MQSYNELPESSARGLALGISFYFTGKPCKRGHLSPKYVSSGNCVECIAVKRGKLNITPKKRATNENTRRAAAALSMGDKTYVPEKNCRHGHLRRCVTTHNCLDCAEKSVVVARGQKRWARIKKEYGLSEVEFYAIMNSQNCSCPICNDRISVEKSHIDHCHTTGKVRGLLCSRCNQGLGLFLESKDRLISACKYLDYHK